MKLIQNNSSNPISQLLGAYTTDYGNGHLELHANYILESGSIVDIIQVPLNISPDAAVELYNSELYPDAEVTKGQINEFKAIYVNGENRKAIHLISDKYAYTILTVFNDIGIDYLEKVAKLIDKN
ncbi:hypothetical protein M3231_04985 [Neobacillus mesonae]|nr:hypothetical protein [Neobacillus mesonae]